MTALTSWELCPPRKPTGSSAMRAPSYSCYPVTLCKYGRFGNLSACSAPRRAVGRSPARQATRYRVSTWTRPCSRGLTSALPCCAVVGKLQRTQRACRLGPRLARGISVGPGRWATDDVLSPPRFRSRALNTDATATDGLGERASERAKSTDEWPAGLNVGGLID